MDKVTKNILEIINARNAIDKLLQQTGLRNKTTYWLDRNFKNLTKALNANWPRIAREVYMKLALVGETGSTGIGDGVSGATIPPEKQIEYQRQLAIAAEDVNEEFEIQIIDLDHNLEIVMRNISGIDQIALAWMLKEVSELEIAGSGIQLVR